MTYDANGNRRTYGGGSPVSYRADNSLAGVEFDAAGRQVGAGSKFNVYDGFDRLCAVSPTQTTSCGVAGAENRYTYDGLDRQISTTNGDGTFRQRYIGSSSTLLTEVNAANGAKSGQYFTSPQGPLAVVNKATTPVLEYLNGNGQGSFALTTTAGSTVTAARGCAVRYDPWGVPTTPAGVALTAKNPCNNGKTSANSAWYRGAMLDESSGNYKMGARTYQPTTGTWLTADNHRGGTSGLTRSIGTDPLLANRYTYVNGDPINLWDPSGHEPCEAADGSGTLPACQADLDALGKAWQRKREERFLLEQLARPDGPDRLAERAHLGENCRSLLDPTSIQAEMKKDEHVFLELECSGNSFSVPDWIGFLISDETSGILMSAVPQPGVEVDFRFRTKVTVIYEAGGARVITESGFEHRVCTTFGIPFLSFCPLGKTPWAVVPGTELNRNEIFIPNVKNPFTLPPADGRVPPGGTSNTIPGGEPTGKPGGFYNPGNPS